jgi:hypothetical protein
MSAPRPAKIKAAPRRPGYDRLWLWFGLSRAGWITLPRVLVHEMPDAWQMKMAKLLEEYQNTFTDWPDGMGSRVQLTDSGKLTAKYRWLHNYRYPHEEEIASIKKYDRHIA